MKKKVEIKIDRLVLHGIPAGQRRAVREAVESELAKVALRDGFAPGSAPAISPLGLSPGPVRLPRGGKS